jgi:hypothetical protein
MGRPNVSTGSRERNMLKVEIPEELMAMVVLFCENKKVSIDQFTIDALSEKLNKWKDYYIIHYKQSVVFGYSSLFP